MTSSIKKTQGAVLVAQKSPLQLQELGLPELKAGQVLVELAYSGICHTQLNEWKGAKGPDPFLPHTLGHEGSGRIVSIGADVQKVSVGDPVVVSWIKGRGADVPGSVYAGQGGPVNSGAVSTFLRHAVVSENRVTPIPPNMPLKEAALLGCAVATGCGIVWNAAKVQEGDSVAVFGVGGIGMCAALAAVAAGANPVIAVDIVPAKLEEARRLGAHHVINSAETDPLVAIRNLAKGGVKIAIESAGRKETMELAFEATRPGGGLCILAGNLSQGERIALDPFALIAGKRIVGTWGGETRPDEDIPRYVKLFLEGKLPIDRLSTKEFPLSQINEAMREVESGRIVRSILNLSGA